MAAVLELDAPAPESSRRGVVAWCRALPRAWPVLALLYGYPILWALGIGPFFAIGLAFPLAVYLLTLRRMVVPKSVGFYLSFLAVVLLSVTMLRGEPPGTLPSSTLGLVFGYSYRLA